MGSPELLSGFDLDDIRPTGIGVHVIIHRDFDPLTQEVNFLGGSLHPADLESFKAAIGGLEDDGWKLYQLKIVVTEGIGGARMLAILAKPRS